MKKRPTIPIDTPIPIPVLRRAKELLAIVREITGNTATVDTSTTDGAYFCGICEWPITFNEDGSPDTHKPDCLVLRARELVRIIDEELAEIPAPRLRHP